MAVLRYFLLLVTIGLLLATGGWLVTFVPIQWQEYSRTGRLGGPAWIAALILGLLCLNLVYLWFSHPGRSAGRKGRL